MDTIHKVAMGITIVIPTFVFAGPIFGIFGIWTAFFYWIAITASLIALYRFSKWLTDKKPY